MYTNTDTSDDERGPEHGSLRPCQPRSTFKVIELIMRKIEIQLRDVAYRECTGNSTSNTRSGTSSVSQQGNRKPSQSSGQKRKTRLEGSPPPDDDDDYGPNKRRRGSAATTADSSESGARFACPFYKHDPDRMKEHLYRSHAQPIFCPICYETFKSDKDQLNHVRLQQCQRSAPQQIEGIDRETIYTLRKRTTALRLEEDKWRDVYHVLFPHVPAADIPSPFYDCDSPSESSRRFRRELLRRVQEELFITAGQMPGPVEQQLLQQVAHIIRRCEDDLLNPPEPTVENAIPPDRRSSDTSAASTGSTGIDSHRNLIPTPRPAPFPAAGPSSSVPLVPFNRLELETDRYQSPAADVRTRYTPEPIVEFTPVIWDEQTYRAFDSIEWELTFPPAQQIQPTNTNGPWTAFSAPMWT
ncbi:Nn.00g079190.m01.CDS01 [Neocucurbitaria sp. VM-36]